MLKLQDREISQHLHDLSHIGLCTAETAVETDGCFRTFVRTFGDADMREEYEGYWNEFDVFPVEWPGCLENCHCRN